MLHTKEQLRKILKNVKFLLGQVNFVEVGTSENVRVGQLREFCAGYPIFGLIANREDWAEVYKVIPFTIDVEFSRFDYPVVVLEEKITLLAGFPFWVYMTRQFLERFSVVEREFSEEEVRRVLEWAEEFKLEELSDLQREYVEALMRVFSVINTASLMQGIIELEAQYGKEVGYEG